ncbi:MAG: ADP-ribosyltransferse [Mycobacterium sp.]
MAPLAVDPEVLDGAGAAVVSTGEGLGSVVSTLTTALAGCDGMAGDDPAGAAFGRSYNNSTSKLLEAMATTRNGLCRLGYGVRMSARNYSVAEAMSNVSGHGEPIPAPHPTAAVSAGSTPSAVGNGTNAPAGWGWVAEYIGMIWPNGDSAKLRAAAAAWTSAGTNFEVSEILGAAGPMSGIGAQQIPEGPAITAAFTDANRSAAGILQQCAKLATQLTAYAAKIDTVHAAILDLLSRICDPMTGLKEVWDILTDKDEDEIKKIANDIRTIINQFTAEVDALRQQIATALSEATTILSTMGRYAEKEWDHFLHGTDVGRTLDHAGQICDGVLTETRGIIGGFWTFNPLRAVVEPDGFRQSVANAIASIEPLVGLDGEHSFEEAWKGLGKDVIHWDEWSKNPFKAAGETAVDLATLALPGGPLSKLPKLGRAAAGPARTLKEFHPPKPHLPNREPPPKTPTPPHDKPPEGGRPAPAPQRKPGPAPHSPTESKVPVTQKPAAGTSPKPAVEPAPSRPGHDPVSDNHSPAFAASAPTPIRPGGVHEPAPVFAGPQSVPSAAASADPLPSYGAPAAHPDPAQSQSTLADMHSPQSAPIPPHEVPIHDPYPGGGHLADPRPPHAWPPGGGGNGHDAGPGDGGGRGGDGGHGGADHDAPAGDETSQTGLTDEKRDEIRAMEKGTRPDPREYLSPEYIEHHLEHFSDGGTRFMLEENLDKYGIGQRDGTTFVFPTSEIDSLIPKGDFAAVERAFGLPDGISKISTRSALISRTRKTIT